MKFLVLNNVTSTWRFLTLTFAGEGQHSRLLATRKLEKMIEKLEAYLKRDVRYIGVVEKHKSNHGIHLHLMIDIPYFLNEDLERKFWRQGFVKLLRIGGKKKKGGIFGTYRYLKKYIEKDIKSSESGKKRYFSSRNLVRKPQSVTAIYTRKHFGLWWQAAQKDGYKVVSNWVIAKEDEEEWVGVVLARKRQAERDAGDDHPGGFDPLHFDVEAYVGTPTMREILGEESQKVLAGLSAEWQGASGAELSVSA